MAQKPSAPGEVEPSEPEPERADYRRIVATLALIQLVGLREHFNRKRLFLIFRCSMVLEYLPTKLGYFWGKCR